MRRIFFFIFILSSLLLPSSIFAQNESASEALSISPFIFERSVEPGQTLQESIKIQNTSSKKLSIDITVNDFTEEKGDGVPVILPETQKLDSNFALASWVQLISPQHLELQPKTAAEVKYSITPPALAEPGGHYAAVLFSYKGEIAGLSSTEITKKVGALIFLKLGKANEQGAIGEFKANNGIFGDPKILFDTKFFNTGNVHLKPKGIVSIYDIFGHQVAALQVNRDAAIVLPQTFRSFSTLWQPRFALGRYTAELHYYFGDNNLEAVSKLSFWIFPLWQLLGLLALLFVIIVIGRWGITRYNRYIIAKAQPKKNDKK